MDQSYNSIGAIEAYFPYSNDFGGFTSEKVGGILSEVQVFGDSSVGPILSYEAFWYPEDKYGNENITFNNFVFNFFLGGPYTDSDVEITDELITRLDEHGKEYRERYIRKIRSFQEFKIVFPGLFQTVKEMVHQNGYRNIMQNDLDDETRRYIYSAYCWMRTYPGINDYALFA